MSLDDSNVGTGAVLADDALLDRLAAGHRGNDGEAIAVLLGTWRSELDQATPAAVSARACSVARLEPARHDVSRVGLTAVVAAILFATGTGAAAAATGTNGPLGVLHRILFGGHHSTAPDPAIARARALLDDAERRISAAAAAGHISRADRQTIAGELGQAADLMRGVTDRADALWQRLAELRHQLAALPTADPGRASAPTTPATGHQSTQPSPATPDDPTQSAAPAPTTRAAQSGEPDSGGQSHDRNERSRSGAGQGSDGEGQDADKQGGDNGDDSQQGEDNSDDRATSDTSSNVPGEDDQDGD